jgi:hypothetical protein
MLRHQLQRQLPFSNKDQLSKQAGLRGHSGSKSFRLCNNSKRHHKQQHLLHHRPSLKRSLRLSMGIPLHTSSTHNLNNPPRNRNNSPIKVHSLYMTSFAL